MNVPFAKKWEMETAKLRQIALACGLTEECKWGKPCFTSLGRNIAIVIPLKQACALSFFKGALLKDPKRVLKTVGEHTQAARWIKFTSVREITAVQATLGGYLGEALALEKSGTKVALRQPSAFPVPDELQSRLDADKALRTAFAALTPGRRKSYAIFISAAMQAKTREARAEKCSPLILSGRGYLERPPRRASAP